MKRFVEGADRGQSTLFPECLDDWVDENNSVRLIDAFVDTLDLAALEFWVTLNCNGPDRLDAGFRSAPCHAILRNDGARHMGL
jgi:hypothetical protein